MASNEETTNYNLRIDTELKERAFLVFEKYGLTASQAMKLFLTQVANTNAIPLSFDYKKNDVKLSETKERDDNATD
ncbi:type II toxin-antitoxin system RelB/DinJ family antitoxin [Acinetobacter sp. B5B]|uniref:type II toxin-antitoxin system RelB/DinJ family antitoxin n=1 Tax=Acinetobacter baretiae TaxID=2605383 RepID=UPI0018C33684|nr:type II toxin-antitoxin system RelB/DinJ family antitoxin [Acinetobacter baretiae]MBF7684167.1 type II toxin-antitoxin system RelB/DinJ family antitoxin [Acinetobacter baretiae]